MNIKFIYQYVNVYSGLQPVHKDDQHELVKIHRQCENISQNFFFQLQVFEMGNVCVAFDVFKKIEIQIEIYFFFHARLHLP